MKSWKKIIWQTGLLIMACGLFLSATGCGELAEPEGSDVAKTGYVVFVSDETYNTSFTAVDCNALGSTTVDPIEPFSVEYRYTFTLNPYSKTPPPYIIVEGCHADNGLDGTSEDIVCGPYKLEPSLSSDATFTIGYQIWDQEVFNYWTGLGGNFPLSFRVEFTITSIVGGTETESTAHAWLSVTCQ